MNSRLKLKQVVTATAATTAMMLGMADANAITLGEPGGALLVPYVACDSTPLNGSPTMNTQVAIVTAGAETLEAFDPSTRVLVDQILDNNFQGPLGAGAGGYGHNLHIVFFDYTSKHKLSTELPVTYNDVALLDWCSTTNVTGNPDTDAAVNPDFMPGYLVIYDANNYKPTGGTPNTGSDFAMWGSAFLIKNGWDSMAFIPVLPLADAAQPNVVAIDPEGKIAGQAANEIIYDRNGRPIDVVPWNAGIKMNNQNGIKDNYILSIRYFLDDSLADKNEFVFWFSENCDGTAQSGGGLGATGPFCNRMVVHTDTFDTAETFKGDAQTKLPYEVNVLTFDAAPPVKELVDGKCMPIQPAPTFPQGWLAGMQNGAIEIRPDIDGGAQFCTNNSGLVFFKIPEAVGGNEGQQVAVDNAQYYTAGVAFNLMFLTAGNRVDENGNPVSIQQVQTELAQERGFDF